MEICVVCGDMRSDMGMGFHDVVRAMQMLISIRACQWQRAYHTHAPIFFVHETETRWFLHGHEIQYLGIFVRYDRICNLYGRIWLGY